MVERQYDVPFALLSDVDASAHKAFKVANTLNEAGVKRLEGFNIFIERWSGQDHNTVAIASMFLIGKDRKVLWAHAAHDYRTRPKTDDVIAAVKKAVGK